MQIESRKRELNSRMRGTEEFTKAALPDGAGGYGPLRWLDRIDGCAIVRDDWCRVGVRASERKCSTLVDVPLPDGTILVCIERSLPSGSGRAKLTGGLVRDGQELWHGQAGIVSCQSVRSGDGWVTRITFEDGRVVTLQDG